MRYYFLMIFLFSCAAHIDRHAEIIYRDKADSDHIASQVIEIFNNDRIRAQNAHIICKAEKLRSSDGFLLHGTLFESEQLVCREYRFRRIGNFVERTNQFTGKVDTVGSKPNAKGEHIYVDLFLKNRLGNKNHKTFGKPGSEVWYGGDFRTSKSNIDKLWQEIESQTEFKEKDFTHWQLGRKDLNNSKILETEDFTQETLFLIKTGKYIVQERITSDKRPSVWDAVKRAN